MHAFVETPAPNSRPQTPNPKPQTPDPKPETQDPNPPPQTQAPNPKPRTPTPTQVRFWDVASGRQVRQLAGLSFAFVRGLDGKRTGGRHVLTTHGDTLLIYEGVKGQQEDGAAAGPVACFKAPQPIFSLQCHGAAICVGCEDGTVCLLSAPFLAA